jgi:heterodisulfide reductase subunit C
VVNYLWLCVNCVYCEGRSPYHSTMN